MFLKRLENYHSSKLLIPRGVNQISTARSSQIVSGNSHGASILQPEIRLRFLRLLSLSSFTPAGWNGQLHWPKSSSALGDSCKNRRVCRSPLRRTCSLAYADCQPKKCFYVSQLNVYRGYLDPLRFFRPQIWNVAQIKMRVAIPVIHLIMPPGGGGYSHILAIRVCAAGKSMVFKPFGLV